MSLNLDKNAWIFNEINLSQPVSKGANGEDVKKIQEWLVFQNFNIKIDGDYGDKTYKALCSLLYWDVANTKDNVVTNDIFQRRLCYPLIKIINFTAQYLPDLPTTIDKTAQFHISFSPREIGGANSGPWVRFYCRGNSGENYPWCAGFVSFIVMQSFLLRGIPYSFDRYTLGCDQLFSRGKKESLVVDGTPSIGDIFFVRNPKNANDKIHTGFVTGISSFSSGKISTIEGNTNDEGSREGYEAVSRKRTHKNLDFISYKNFKPVV